MMKEAVQFRNMGRKCEKNFVFVAKHSFDRNIGIHVVHINMLKILFGSRFECV